MASLFLEIKLTPIVSCFGTEISSLQTRPHSLACYGNYDGFSGSAPRQSVSPEVINWHWLTPLLWANVHWLVQCTLECHWNVACWPSVHWDTTGRPSEYCSVHWYTTGKIKLILPHTGMPLAKLLLLQPTSEHHWREYNSPSTHQARIVKHSGIHASLKWQYDWTSSSKCTGLCKFSFYRSLMHTSSAFQTCEDFNFTLCKPWIWAQLYICVFGVVVQMKFV